MKKLFTVLLVAVLMLTCSNFALADGYNNEGYVISKNVTIRTGPGENYEKIASGKNGEVYNVISEENNWYGLKLDDGQIGYAMSEYIVINPKIIYLSEEAPVYAWPSVTNKRVGYVGAGEKFIVIAEDNNFYAISFRTGMGFISKSTIVITNTDVEYYISQTPIVGVAIKDTTVRIGSGSNFKSIGKISKGDNVNIYAMTSDYYLISFVYNEDEIIAYVIKNDIVY